MAVIVLKPGVKLESKEFGLGLKRGDIVTIKEISTHYHTLMGFVTDVEFEEIPNTQFVISNSLGSFKPIKEQNWEVPFDAKLNRT